MTDHLTEAARLEAAAAESFERCDTDGFLTQWACGITAREHRLQATIDAAGGLAEFPALFDLEGNLVAAKVINTRYGTKFAVFATDEDAVGYGAQVLQWVDPFVKPATLARKGYRLGKVLAPAKATIYGTGTGLSGAASCQVVTVRTDGGFARNVTVVDNGLMT